MKKYISLLFASLFLFALMSFVSRSLNDPWPVPDKYKNMPNPVKSDATSLATGKALYNQHCKSCHGTKGKGDGPKAAQLNTECGDFTKPSTQSETDGALFYKTSEGRKDMPSFKKKIADQNDVWAVVNYLRTLK
ncbi:MAG TPA: c-type cytochrome [Chitinophagaceae bacterium]|jgi:mono/diheme cytochrome c family protein|nr:c-type cytochrome [Chitinophagaceae bacterium]